MSNAAQLMPLVYQQFFDSNGVPLAGGSLYSYQAGTSTPLSTYTDATAGTPNANPVVLDTRGGASVWIGSSAYKFILKDASGNTIATQDNVQSINDGYITATMIANGAVGTTQLASAAVTTAKMALQSVDSTILADNSVTNAKISGIVGNLPIGSITMFHTFNGAVSIPRGWMKANGDIVNQTNYEAIHTGFWTADGIASGALNGKHLPNLVSRYPFGVSSTTQDGSATITAVGTSGSALNLQHNHNFTHTHGWWGYGSSTGDDTTFNGSNVTSTVAVASNSASAVGTSGDYGLAVVNKGAVPSGIRYMDTSLSTNIQYDPQTTGNTLSASQDIRPDSIEVIYIIKVI